MQDVFILVGAPGSGKSWIARQLNHKFEYVPHDTYGLLGFESYVKVLARKAMDSEKPVLCDTPFSLSQIKEPLENRGIKVHPVFVIESPDITRSRYEARDKKPIPKGHLTRIGTYAARAKELKAPRGTSEEMLRYLKSV